jgi:NADP-reducing hydrogenase subunit HndB
MTLDDLRKLRGEKKAELDKRDGAGKTAQVIVGMGTCGIAAGAKLTLDAFVNELEAQGIGDVTAVRQTGCMGMCSVEPTVEVQVPGMTGAIYGNVKAEVVKRIVESHLVNKTPIPELIVARREQKAGA